MRTITWSRVAINLTVIALIVVWTVPTIGLFITSFRDKQAISNSGWWTVFTNPQGAFTLDNYQKVLFGGDGLATAFLNTLAVTIPAVVIPILIAAFAAYGFAWMDFPGRRVLFITVVALLVVPLQIALIPVLKAYLAIDLNGTFLAVWLAHAGFGLALATYLLYNYISQLPKDIIESAALDGASHFTTFRRLILPLSTACAGSVRDLPVPVGLERPPGGDDLPRHRPGRRRHDLAAGLDDGVARPGLAAPHGRRVRLDDRARHGLPGTPAVLRQGSAGRLGQGMMGRPRGAATSPTIGRPPRSAGAAAAR